MQVVERMVSQTHTELFDLEGEYTHRHFQSSQLGNISINVSCKLSAYTKCRAWGESLSALV